MKTVILHNVDINNFSTEDELYLSGARVTYAITHKNNHVLMPESSKNRKNTIFLMWDDRKFDKEANCYDEKLSPSPISRVCDFVSDIIDDKSDAEHICNMIKRMRCCETLHYDVLNYTFDV